MTWGEGGLVKPRRSLGEPPKGEGGNLENLPE